MKNLLLFPLFFFAACTAGSKDSASKTPDIMEQIKARQEFERRRQLALKEQQDQYFKNPLKPLLAEGQVFRGPASAKITIVEYTDFECPFCSRGAETMKVLRTNFGSKVRFTVKHLPLSFHRYAMIAAQYYEAIALQSKDKAGEFHDRVFEGQDALKTGGEKFLEKVTTDIGADLTQVKKDLNSKAVKTKIDADIAEANRFGFTGTPAFVVNGVPIKGAQPPQAFVDVIERHLSSN
ncbi:MAG: thioredoxin domain-containing protein [Bdellovibrionaceae bacterium]|nr:thioredoxin domain-containing protein [Bdellovibrionales bacterium]MCB9254961.1 thioredoxin domain-containing protein [Pseudobdellovibrionaceae bacterium]